MKIKVLMMTMGPSFLSVLLAGCAGWTTPVSASRPYFVANQQEVNNFQSLARKHEALVSKCTQSNSCDQVYFTLGLLGLYESREVAGKYFSKVLGIAPMGPWAASSKAWIQVLQEPATFERKLWSEAVLTAPAIAGAHTSLALTTDRLVRDLLDREMVIQKMRSSKVDESETVDALQRELAERDRKIEALLSKKDAAKASADPVAVQNLQKQLAERDRKVEELSSQLEALKRIDQEMREKVRPIRPPLTTVPVPSPETTP